jgi:hypothetical protein
MIEGYAQVLAGWKMLPSKCRKSDSYLEEPVSRMQAKGNNQCPQENRNTQNMGKQSKAENC